MNAEKIQFAENNAYNAFKHYRNTVKTEIKPGDSVTFEYRNTTIHGVVLWVDVSFGFFYPRIKIININTNKQYWISAKWLR